MADPTPQQIAAMKKLMAEDAKKAIATKTKVDASEKAAKAFDEATKKMKAAFKSEPD